MQAVKWIDEGMVKRIRGFSFSTKVSSQFENTMVHEARGIFNSFIPDVYIYNDHRVGVHAGKYVSNFYQILFYLCIVDNLGKCDMSLKVVLNFEIDFMQVTGLWNFIGCGNNFWLLSLC